MQPATKAKRVMTVKLGAGSPLIACRGNPLEGGRQKC